ncbi:4-hydroxy-tetrahydrodipicolinate synthase [Parasegetibacter sp. NRK P23]|uniref:4-hydroxy-tetrahydrodipicolinate synthase n=1 Tax=Parasegetibacter sp. NRK P23 TaxID=2942999 RepID=UPI002043B1D3|nr:4-hydroxy-tetrahydrodipicolinate synthase [Parasegetibacter sp. NRK P23]MCM5527220.1 4-hydroxy-tetrahydrodipicolinate synthase [Parasegetibacter sp. NRK P23]
MSLQTTLRGTGVALVTPFDAAGSIDFNALERVIDFVIDGGVQYVVTLGTTGETPTLSKEEKKDIAVFTFEKVNSRVPVVVGAGGNNTAEVIKEMAYLPCDKAAAILSASPYYNKPSQEGLFQHYKAIAANTPAPILLYNVPGRTGRNLEAKTTLRLAHDVANIAGIKEASGDMAQCMQILRDKPENFLVVSGDDALVLPQVACGMEGVISVAANSFPKQFTSMVNACLNGDFANAKKLNDQLIEGYELLFAENNPAGVKAAMQILGLIENEVRLPVVPLSEGLYEKMKDYVGRLS